MPSKLEKPNQNNANKIAEQSPHEISKEEIRANILDIVEGYVRLLNEWERLEDDLRLDINETAALELSDRLHQESEWPDIKDLEGLKGHTVLDEKTAREILKIDFQELTRIVDKQFNNLIEKINKLPEDKIKFSHKCSLVDILNNNTLAKIYSALQAVNSLWKTGDLSDLRPAKISLLGQLKKSLDQINLYLDEINSNPEKMQMELTRKDGWLEKFTDFFPKIKTQKNGQEIVVPYIPTGPNKIPFIMFFSRLERGEITKEDLDKEINKLQTEYIKDTEKFKKKAKKTFMLDRN